eukprot:g2868.t1
MPAPNLSVIRLEPVTALPYWFHTDLPGHDDIKCNKELEEFIGSGMAKFWETPNGLKLMADGKRRLVQSAEKFCAPFSKSDTSGAPLPPYACVTKSYSTAIGAALGIVNSAFSLMMFAAPYVVAWLVTRGWLLSDTDTESDEEHGGKNYKELHER